MFAGAAGGVPRAVWWRGHGHVFWDVVEVQLPPFHLLMHVRYHLAVTLACLVAAAPSAQDGTPDPTPPEAYYPLDVGNEWVYVANYHTAYREVVVGDTVVSGVSYAVVARTSIAGEDWGHMDTTRFFVRIDPETSHVVFLQEGAEVTDGCPLTADFPDGTEGSRPVYCGTVEATLTGGPDQYIEPGLIFFEILDAFVATAKSFHFPDGTGVEYAAGIGRVARYWTDPTHGLVEERIVYSRVGGVETGLTSRPDPTDPAAYYPLAVGTERESLRGNAGTLVHTRRVVTRDTTIGGVSYAVERTFVVTGHGVPEWGDGLTRFLRYDEATTAVNQRLPDGSERAVTCPFGTPFWVVVQCPGFPAVAAGSAGDGSVTVAGESVPTAAVKGFWGLDPIADTGGPAPYAAGLGELAISDFGPCGGPPICFDEITYLRLVDPDGTVREYGARYPVVANERPGAGALAVAAFPNPSAGPLTVAVDSPAAANITLEAFDALGRRVWLETAVLDVGRERVDIDASRWAPGLYVIRALADGSAVTTIAVRR